MNRDRSQRLFFTLVWLFFIIRGTLYAIVTPMWEGFDEPFHFAYVHLLTATRALPVWGEAFVDSDVAESTAYLPLPRLMPPLVANAPALSYRDFWQMDKNKREGLMSNLRRLRASSERSAPSQTPLYQLQHPPLYYFICAPLYRMLDNRSIVDKVFALRLFSVFVASLCVMAAFLATKTNNLAHWPIFAGLVSLWPCLYIDVGRVGNDSLGVTIFSFLFLAMIWYGSERSAWRAVALGAALGAGLLTKAYFLTAVPAIFLFLVLLLAFERTDWKARVMDAALVFVCAGIIGGWWYIRNLYLYGNFSGLQETMHFPAVGMSERVRAALELPWVLVTKNLFVTFCWVSGWSFVHLPKAFHFVFVLLFGGALAGFLKAGLHRKKGPGKAIPPRNGVLAAVCLIFFFALGAAYHKINAAATVRSIGGPGGWYFYALVVPISYLVSLGTCKWGAKVRRYAFPLAFIALLLVEAYGFLFVLLPYYSGFATPAASGWGLVFEESVVHVFSGEAVIRLLTNKPEWLGASVLAFFAAAYCAASIAVLSIIATLTGKTERS
ncbi:MAG: hypothetical protein C4532_05935 [Candidatus Abyssobacteria bacterium SURF_17]|uniref:Glycosyltransferase RgtA/B/C/D-like domain-containing protein n=1 Tax=Candidatus Abyssobacteria bacterium SURF_17 TaxID=2093361 RepID=A0A419F2F5_9BACT|nr:MAG: hypothetical protein C4532_05935 [Candidatus Abyssubacteria bacterium SURF_17]